MHKKSTQKGPSQELNHGLPAVTRERWPLHHHAQWIKLHFTATFGQLDLKLTFAWLFSKFLLYDNKVRRAHYTWFTMNQQPVSAAPASMIPLAMSKPYANKYCRFWSVTVTRPHIFVGRPCVSSVRYFQWKCHGQRSWAINQTAWENDRAGLLQTGNIFFSVSDFLWFVEPTWDENQSMLQKHFITKTENKCLESVIGDREELNEFDVWD